MKLLETITPEAISALPSGDGQALGYNPTTGTLVRVPSAAAAVAGLGMKLRGAMASTGFINLLDSRTTSAATLTSSATADATLTSSYSPTTGAVSYRNMMNGEGGWGGSVVASLNPTVWSTQIAGLEFVTTAQKVQVSAYALDASGIARVWVDGAYAGSVTGVDPQGQCYIFITFATATSRRILIRFSRTPYLPTVSVMPADLVVPVTTTPRAVLIGDSVDEGFDATDKARSHGPLLGDLLGLDMVCSAKSGSGVIASGSGLPYPVRFQHDVSTQEWDLIVVKCSENDGVLATSAEISAAMIAFLTTVRARYPLVPIALFGYSPGFPGDLAAHEAAMASSHAAWGDAKSMFFPTATWWGAAQATALGSHHPTDAGHVMRARMEASAIRSWLT